MKTIEERLDALVSKAIQEEYDRVLGRQILEHDIIEKCLSALEKSNDLTKNGAIVEIPKALISDLTDGSCVHDAEVALTKLLQDKVKVSCIGQSDNDNSKWVFRLIVKSMP